MTVNLYVDNWKHLNPSHMGCGFMWSNWNNLNFPDVDVILREGTENIWSCPTYDVASCGTRLDFFVDNALGLWHMIRYGDLYNLDVWVSDREKNWVFPWTIHILLIEKLTICYFVLICHNCIDSWNMEINHRKCDRSQETTATDIYFWYVPETGIFQGPCVSRDESWVL